MSSKRLHSFLLFCGMLMAFSYTTSGGLILPEEYIRKVTARMVSIIEKDQITGRSMPIRTFEQAVNVSDKGLTLDGRVKFHSGFVSSIKKAYLSNTGYRSGVTDKQSSISASFVLNGLQLIYDVDYELTDYRNKGIFLLWCREVIFELLVSRPHNTKEIQASIQFIAVRQNEMVTEVYPNNGYTQLLAREVKRKIEFRGPILKSFEDWESKWKGALNKAVSEYDFPAICYYCPDTIKKS